MPGPRGFQQIIAQSIKLSSPVCLLPTVYPEANFGEVSEAHLLSHSYDAKENMINQTRSPSSNAPWSSPDVGMWMLTKAFSSEQHFQLGQHEQSDQSAATQLHTQQDVMFCGFWHLPIIARNISSANCATVAFLRDWLEHPFI